MFKCHADMINYLFTYLTLFCIFKFFNNNLQFTFIAV